ncbi:MAG: hypothetical protein M1383_04175 [Patescibacteria group bacterium]|nr:hypothetical protein [Patescibacteria group bacterium]
MKKFIVALLLICIIILSFGFTAIKLWSLGPEGNYFNSNLRLKFAKYPVARQILGLHFDGDARTDYLGPRFGKISVEVDSMQGLEIPYAVLKQMAEKIGQLTGKETSFFQSDDNLPYLPDLSEADVKSLAKQYRNESALGETASLYLLVASRRDESMKELGSSLEEYGMVIFYDSLQEFTRDNPATFNNYLLSTILHEFGHQLGLPHNELDGCLMNENAEASHNARPSPETVLVNFCPEELAEIKENARLSQ